MTARGLGVQRCNLPGRRWTKAGKFTVIKDSSTQFTTNNNVHDILYCQFHVAKKFSQYVSFSLAEL